MRQTLSTPPPPPFEAPGAWPGPSSPLPRLLPPPFPQSTLTIDLAS